MLGCLSFLFLSLVLLSWPCPWPIFLSSCPSIPCFLPSFILPPGPGLVAFLNKEFLYLLCSLKGFLPLSGSVICLLLLGGYILVSCLPSGIYQKIIRSTGFGVADLSACQVGISLRDLLDCYECTGKQMWMVAKLETTGKSLCWSFIAATV